MQAAPARVDQRRLADAARAVHGGDRRRRRLEVEAFENHPPTASEGRIAHDQRSRSGRGRGADRQRRSCEQLVEVDRSIEPGLGGMEAGSDPTKRQVALGCQQEHDERGAEIEAAAREAEADLDRDQRHRQRCDELQCQRRQERDPKCAHRGRAILLRDVVHRVALGPRPTEQAQGRHPLDHVEEVAAELLEDGPLARGSPLGHAADQHHEDWDQGHGQSDQHRREHVGEQDPRSGNEGDRHRQHQRREELTDVRLELLDAGRDDGGLAAGESRRRTVGIERGVVQHGDAYVVAQRRHRSG